MKQVKLLLPLLLMMSILYSCSKKDNNNVTTSTGPQTNDTTADSALLYFHLHTYLGQNEVDNYNLTYTLTTGRRVSLSLAQLYLSNVQLVHTDGSFYNVPNVVLLKVLDSEVYYAAKVPVGTYASVRFIVGLDSSVVSNATIAATTASHPEMYFSPASNGYTNINVQGSVDTSATPNQSATLQPFAYELNGKYQVTMPDHSPAYTFDSGAVDFIHIIIDYSQLFNNVQLNNPSNLMITTPAANSTAIGNTISSNVPNMFRYEE